MGEVKGGRKARREESREDSREERRDADTNMQISLIILTVIFAWHGAHGKLITGSLRIIETSIHSPNAPSTFELYETGAGIRQTTPRKFRAPTNWRFVTNGNPRAAVARTFLPTGWPQSVPAEYLSYQRYHVLQVNLHRTLCYWLEFQF
jgi:hypothetical protein